MKKQRFYYRISGYRWAPESFRIEKGLANQPKKEVPLTREERSEVANRFLTRGFREAIGYVKHIERERAHRHRSYMAYGFWVEGNTRQYIYCPLLRCKAEANLADRLHLYKEVRKRLMDIGGRVVVSTTCELDGNYIPTRISHHTVNADFSRPLRIWLTDI